VTGANLGSPLLSGHHLASGSGWDVRAGGADIWGQSDEGYFLAAPVLGDFTATVRVSSLGLSHPYAKAGIMARFSRSPESPFLYFFVFPDNRPRNRNNGGYEGHLRLGWGESAQGVYPPTSIGEPEFPVIFPSGWLRMTRRGAELVQLASSDGAVWRVFFRIEISLPATLEVGLAATSHACEHFTTVEFRDWSLES